MKEHQPTEPVEQLRCRILPDGRMPAKDASVYLGHSTTRMATWRMEGIGPRWIRIGGKIFYRKQGLDDFIERESQRRGQLFPPLSPGEVFEQ